MKKLHTAIAIAAILVASCSPFGAPAFATAMPECATGQGDTNEAVAGLLSSNWPMDAIYLFEGEPMYMFLAAIMAIRLSTVLPPADTTEVWVSHGPGGDGSTVIVLFADDCYLGDFKFTAKEFEEALKIADLQDYKPLKEGGQSGSNHNIIVPLKGARSA